MTKIDRILKLMDEHGVKAITLTTEAGLARSAISDWKKGKYEPSYGAIVKIAEYFGIDVDYLMSGEGTSSPKVSPAAKRVDEAMLKRGIDHYFRCPEIMSFTGKGVFMEGLANQFPARYGLTKEKLKKFKNHEEKPTYKDLFRMLDVFEPHMDKAPGTTLQLLGLLYESEQTENQPLSEQEAAGLGTQKIDDSDLPIKSKVSVEGVE